MTLKIIGAGLGRTGTESMKRALEILGYAPCHHMYEVIPHKDRYDRWLSLIRDGAAPDWDAIFAGFRATVDWPAAHYWRELAEHYPDARIILTTRSGDSWYASMDRTILTFMREPGATGMAAALGRRLFGDRVDDREFIVDTFHRHNAAVQAAFGPDRLLTHDLGSGWAPLCAFLGVAEPDIPYPRGNATADFHASDAALTAIRERPEG